MGIDAHSDGYPFGSQDKQDEDDKQEEEKKKTRRTVIDRLSSVGHVSLSVCMWR